VYVTLLLIQALYELVLAFMLAGVGGKNCNTLVVAVVPTTLQLLMPFTLKEPPVKPVLNNTVMVALSVVAEVMMLLAGTVQRYFAIAVCVVEGVLGIAVKDFEEPIQTAKSPATVVITATVAGEVLALMITVLAELIEQGLTDFTERVSFTKHEANVTITAVSFTPAALMCVMVALVPLFKYQLYEVAYNTFLMR